MKKKYKLEDLEIEEYEPKFFKKTKSPKNKKRKLTRKQWLVLQEEEENIKIEKVETYGFSNDLEEQDIDWEQEN